jgi:hypothetical protein
VDDSYYTGVDINQGVSTGFQEGISTTANLVGYEVDRSWDNGWVLDASGGAS